MFSIAAINDTESKSKWEPLAPTKEAQEFHLSQTYHEGLLKLQAKEYTKARELLEAVLKDSLISSAQGDSSASDGHLLQLRFLALKNLANVFLQQGSMHYESALNCYLQAVEIDTKDSVVWNQLGTLSCSMGLLSISRWAFEQGLYCSPNNWNCMEKLLEVLIAIRDEIACLSIAELILRHWPSHPRALHVKNTIQELDPVPFSPRGIDKLEPKHIRLNFSEKRKRMNPNLEEGNASKRHCNNIDVHLVETSWEALTDSLLRILFPVNRRVSEPGAGNSQEDLANGKIDCGQSKATGADTNAQEGEIVVQTSGNVCYNKNPDRCGDIRLSIHLPSNSENCTVSTEGNGEIAIPTSGTLFSSECGIEKTNTIKEKEGSTAEEHPQERRSTRLERLRNRRPGKEELDFATSQDLAKSVVQVLEPFIIGRSSTKDFDQAISDARCPEVPVSLSDNEHAEVLRFVTDASKNYGAYHVGYLLLENVAHGNLPYQETFVKFLELEKLTRHWGQDKSIDCCLFLAELYCDVGLCSTDESKKSASLSEASYHLCKIIELLSLDSPVDWNGLLNLNKDSNTDICMSDVITSGVKSDGAFGNEIPLSTTSAQGTGGVVRADSSVSHELLLNNSILTTKGSFWVRFFWLSGCLSILAGDKVKAYEEFCISLVLLRKNQGGDGLSGSVLRPHCKFTRELTVERVLHEIHLLKVDFLLEKTLNEMMEKEMYLDCVYLLAPLLLSTGEVYLNHIGGGSIDNGGVMSAELSALDILIKACEKAKPVNIEIYLKCHRRKLQVLLVAAGMAEHKTAMPKPGSPLEMKTIESISQHWSHLVVEEVKAISHCASQVKSLIDQTGNPDSVPVNIIGDIQAFLLVFMRNIISIFLCKKSLGSETADETQQIESCTFLEAVITFCKLQHFNQSVPVKTQVELIVAIHDLLAEYGLCCSGKDSAGEEGMFLKLAIKHLLVLDMKMKSDTHSSNKGSEATHCDELPKHSTLDETNETSFVKKDSSKNLSDVILTQGLIKDDDVKDGRHNKDDKLHQSKDLKAGDQVVENEELSDTEEKFDMGIENALDQCFFCLYGLNLRSSDSFSEDDLSVHKNTSRGDYQTKEQCADVFQYILPYAKASSRTGLVKLRRVLRAIRKHFRQPPEDLMKENSINNFLDDPNLCEDKICEEAGTDGVLDYILSIIFPNGKNSNMMSESSDPYLEVYGNLYYFLAQAEETSATDKWPGFVLTKEGEEFVEQNTNLFNYDLLYNPLRFESWQQLANIYDEEVDLLLNDGSKHINVVGWRKNPSLPQRVETSRRRSRRCLLMSLALAKTPAQRSEIHELLALVYYDGIQNVVPIYDQRSVAPTKDALWTTFCQNSMKHFEKAFAHKPDWSHAFYLGKLCEKMGYPYEKAFSYYEKAISLNPSAVDPVYRMHASRLKLLSTCERQNVEALKVVALYSFDQSNNATVGSLIDPDGFVIPDSESPFDVGGTGDETDPKEKNGDDESRHLEEAWQILYSDCLSALEICVEGELKHFHKARYMLAQGWYRRVASESLQRAKDELSFCFKSSRSSFTINMWEIDSTVRKGRRKASDKKVLDVNLAESSRKFITCIRKYILFYLKLLLESGDICTLDRAYTSLRADKRFSLCLEDLVPVALGRLIQALMSSICQSETLGKSFPQHHLERMFNLFIDQGNILTDMSSLFEVKSPELSETKFFSYLHQYIHSLERDLKLDILEGINEKIRKRFKNPKLASNNCSRVFRHASVAWCRSILLSLVLITPLDREGTSLTQVLNPTTVGSENMSLLGVSLQRSELWNSSVEDQTHLKGLETKWDALLSKINGIVIKQALAEKMESANALLRSAYNFYRESSCGALPSGINLYTVPCMPATEPASQLNTDGAEIIELSVPRKLLLWAYALVNGRYTNILAVVKHCEENAKLKVRKGTLASSASLHTSSPTSAATQTGPILLTSSGSKERTPLSESCEPEINPPTTAASASLPETDETHNSGVPPSSETQRSDCTAAQPHQGISPNTERSNLEMQEGGNIV